MKNKFNSFSKKSSTKDYYRLISKENLIKKHQTEYSISQIRRNINQMKGVIFTELKHWLMPYESMFEVGNYFSLVTMQPLVLDKIQEKLTQERTSSDSEN